MEYIILLHVGDKVKHIEEATPEELNKLQEKAKREALKHLGLRYVGKLATR